MSAYMHHEEYDPALGVPTKQHLIELIDYYSDRPVIPVFNLAPDGTFTTLVIVTATKVGGFIYPSITTDPSSSLALRYYVGCRECYALLKQRLGNPTADYLNLLHPHNKKPHSSTGANMKLSNDHEAGITVGRLRSILGYAIAEYERPLTKVKATYRGTQIFVVTNVEIDDKTGEVMLKLLDEDERPD